MPDLTDEDRIKLREVAKRFGCYGRSEDYAYQLMLDIILKSDIRVIETMDAIQKQYLDDLLLKNPKKERYIRRYQRRLR
jgi:hypothetical protein